MQNNIDYKEIVQTVTQNVMTEIVNKLNAMKPGIEQEIAEAVFSVIDSRLNKLESSLNSLQSSVTELKQTPRNPAARATPVVTPRTIARAASSSSASSAMDTQTRVLLLKIKKQWLSISHKGWIIYVNEEDKHTYMIRENGTDQIDISPFFNGTPCNFWSLVVNGSDWIIEYTDGVTLKKGFAVIPMS